MKSITLSILTPCIPERMANAAELHAVIAGQINECGADGRVEHLILTDNRSRSIGAKRQALVDIAGGEYIAFVDDDDMIRPNYVRKILEAAETAAGVITFRQAATVNDLESVVVFRHGQDDGPFRPGGETMRGAWHSCAWRRDLVAGCLFGESNYGEDLVWCRQARKRVRNEVHIPEILHEYRHSTETTAAPVPA